MLEVDDVVDALGGQRPGLELRIDVEAIVGVCILPICQIEANNVAGALANCQNLATYG